MFMGMYHRSDTGEFPPYGTEYEIKLESGVRTTFHGLGDDTCPTVFFTQEKKFDDFCVESGLFKKIEELKKEIDSLEEQIIDMTLSTQNILLSLFILMSSALIFFLLRLSWVNENIILLWKYYSDQRCHNRQEVKIILLKKRVM